VAVSVTTVEAATVETAWPCEVTESEVVVAEAAQRQSPPVKRDNNKAARTRPHRSSLWIEVSELSARRTRRLVPDGEFLITLLL
jgi:hypothetical protein